jgi:hypothetical protein
MTLGDLKKKTLALIEEINPDVTSLTDDPDIEAKLPYVINQILHELARFKKIPAYEEIEVEKGDILDLTTLGRDEDAEEPDTRNIFYQLDIIRNVEYEYLDNLHVRFLEDGTALVKYFRYPVNIDEDTADTTILDLSDDALEIAPYGIAADVLKADVSNQYGTIYANRYREMIQSLDSRYSMGSVEFDGGLEI